MPKRFLRRVALGLAGLGMAAFVLEFSLRYLPAVVTPRQVQAWFVMRSFGVQTLDFHVFDTEDKDTGWRVVPGRAGIVHQGDPEPPFLATTGPIHDARTGLPIEGVGVRMPVHERTAHVWLALGDSFTFGTGVADDEAWPHVLETKLAGQATVINGGVAGYGTEQAVQWFKKYGRRLQPRWVLLGFFTGDVGDNASQMWVETGRHRVNRVSATVRHALKVHSALYFLLDRWNDELKARLRTPHAQGDPFWVYRIEKSLTFSQGWQQTEAAILELDRAVKAGGSRLAVVYLPWGVEIFPSEAVAAEGKAPMSAYNFQVVHDLMADLCHRHQIVFIDPTDALKTRAKDAELYFGLWRAHMTAAGHAVVADVTATAVKEYETR